MAKRFTDSLKWDKASFQGLSPKFKLIWIFLCDKCDHAGVWDINLSLMSFQIGFPVTLDEIIEGFEEKVELRGPNKLFVPDFIEFQYGALNPDNRVHQSVMVRLNKLPENKGLASPSQGAKDKDKDKDKDKAKDKEGECEGETATPIFNENLKPNSSQLFQAQNDTETAKFKEFFASKALFSDFDRYANQLKIRFKNIELFETVYEGWVTGPAFEKVKVEGDPAIRRYIGAILADELGTSRRARS